MEIAFKPTGVRQENTWTLAYIDDSDETRTIVVSLSDLSAERLMRQAPSQNEFWIADAVARIASARTRSQDENFEISDVEVDEFLANN